MKRIGLLSDTHSYLDKSIFKYFEECDEIWHAGDIGDIQVIRDLESLEKQKIRRNYLFAGIPIFSK